MTRKERIINDCDSVIKDMQRLRDSFHADDSLTTQEKTILEVALTNEMARFFAERNIELNKEE